MTRPVVSIALPPSKRIVDYAIAAEQAGCRRIWLFDSPAVYGDIWVGLARVVEGTHTIGVGTGVAVPSLRHPLVTASAIATIEDLAPGRLVTAFGTGYTATRAMGQKPMRWADLAAYLDQVRRLLAGEVVVIDGAPAQMLHLADWGPPRPIETPLWTAPSGPKGLAASAQVGADGVILTSPPQPTDPTFATRALLVNGTVVDPGEDHTSPRVVDAAGPWFAASFHAVWEYSPDYLQHMPGGPDWRAEIERLRPEDERHLAVHEGHIVAMTERDRAAVTAAGPAVLSNSWTGSPEEIAARLDQAGAAGIDEVLYSPAGPDIESEISRFAEVASR